LSLTGVLTIVEKRYDCVRDQYDPITGVRASKSRMAYSQRLLAATSGSETHYPFRCATKPEFRSKWMMVRCRRGFQPRESRARRPPTSREGAAKISGVEAIPRRVGLRRLQIGSIVGTERVSFKAPAATVRPIAPLQAQNFGHGIHQRTSSSKSTPLGCTGASSYSELDLRLLCKA
jgi:hypothetical protein